jgi:hypothetical protein
MIGKALPPQALVSLMKFSPLPSKVVADFEKSIEEAAQAAAQQPDPATMKAQAEIEVKKVDAETKQQLMQADLAKMQAEMQLEREKAAQEAQARQQELQAFMAETAAKIEAIRLTTGAKVEATRQAAQTQNDIARDKAETDKHVTLATAHNNIEAGNKMTDAKVAQTKKMQAAKPKPAKAK